MKRLDAEYFFELLILLNSTYSQVSNNNSNSNTNFWYQLIEFMQQTSDNITLQKVTPRELLANPEYRMIFKYLLRSYFLTTSPKKRSKTDFLKKFGIVQQQFPFNKLPFRLSPKSLRKNPLISELYLEEEKKFKVYLEEKSFKESISLQTYTQTIQL